MKIYVLAENTANDGFELEHGLSLYISTDEINILFDMGQSDLFIRNAARLGLDLSSVDMAVLSHGHYDHGGGIRAFMEINHTATVFVSAKAFGDYYNGEEKYIGIDKALCCDKRIKTIDKNDFLLASGVRVVTLNHSISDDSIDSAGLTVKNGTEYEAETFLHEQYMIVEHKGKRIVFSGCSHKGAVNIAKELNPDVFIGGFHYSKIPVNGDGASRLYDYGKQLMSFGCKCYTCHCTGKAQFELLKKIMGDGVEYISAGAVIEI